jgi:hypothetical protein
VPNDNVTKLVQPGSFEDPLTEVLRAGARTLLAQAVETEVAVKGRGTFPECGLPIFPSLAAWACTVISRCLDHRVSFLVVDHAVWLVAR